MNEQTTDEFNSHDDLTPQEMRSFFSDEVANVTKGAELRIRELAELMARFHTGEITAERATELAGDYKEKWGDAVPGVYSVKGKTDAELMAAVNEEYDGRFASRATESKVPSEKRSR
jgi:hypothetical protein